MPRRRSINPAKLRASISALERKPPEEIFRHRLELRRRISVVLLSLLTVVLLTVSFPPFDCWYLAYVALVPWALALAGGTRRRWAILWAWLSGLIFWAGNLYWLWWITLVGYAVLVIYLSAYWLVTALVVGAAIRRRLPLWLVFPVVWVSLEYARAYVISGFPWLFLAHSQYARTRLIQIADVTGQYGVSFFVAMVNGVVIDLLCSPLFVRARRGPRMTRHLFAGPILVVAVLAGLLGYGTWRLGQDTSEQGPVLAIVQPAFRVSLHGRDEPPEKIFADHVDRTREFQQAGCDLVIWPETVLPGGLNHAVLEVDPDGLTKADVRALASKYLPPDRLEQRTSRWLRDLLAGLIRTGIGPDGGQITSLRQYAQRLVEFSGKLGCPILAGGITLHRDGEPVEGDDRWVRRNSALWFDRTWFDADRANPEPYSKMHLVPFSEHVPFKRSWLGLHRVLRRFVPAEMPQLDPGRRIVRFELRRDGRRWLIAAPICYEGTFARLCRRMVMDGASKKVDILANLSNDGWFIWQWPDGTYHGSTELPQHLVQYCFRAVENRVPVVRAVNTGISASIDSAGRIVACVRHGSKRRMVAGTLLLDGRRANETEYLQGHGPKVLVDRRVSAYSLIGDVFAQVVSAAAVGLVGWLTVQRFRKGTQVA